MAQCCGALKRFLGGFPEAGNASASPGASSAGCEDRPDWPDGAGAGLVMPSASGSWMGQPCLTWPWVTELCRLVLWQVSLCRGQSPGSCHSRILPRVTSADAAAMAGSCCGEVVTASPIYRGRTPAQPQTAGKALAFTTKCANKPRVTQRDTSLSLLSQVPSALPGSFPTAAAWLLLAQAAQTRQAALALVGRRQVQAQAQKGRCYGMLSLCFL